MVNHFTIHIRATGGTYMTSRVGGKHASCTAGPRQAAEALAVKLGASVAGDVKYVGVGIYEAILREKGGAA